MAADPITPITLENAEGRKAAFMPQSDMTALESALLTQLFVKMIVNGPGPHLDWEGYVRQYGLERHFAREQPLVETLPSGDLLTKIIIAERDLPGVTKGTKLQVLTDMPILDGWAELKGEEAA